jgi:RimJ/RimL family protein N-acetyltransferase
MHWMPWLKEDYKLSDAVEFLKIRIEKWETGNEREYIVFDNQNGKALGRVGLNSFDERHKYYNLGYWIRVSQQNLGIASEATRLLAEEAFRSLEISRIEILAAVGNVPSQKAAEKAGATREGILRKRLAIGGEIHDAVIYSFVKEDFA